MTISPIDIQQHQFKSRLIGYEKSGVDHYLELIAEELERYHRQVQELKEELSHARASLQELRQREATVKETLMTAQQMIGEIKSNAHKEAEICLAEAELEAERIVREAQNRRLQMLSEIQEIRRQKISFESSLRGVVEAHLRMLNLDPISVDDISVEGRWTPAIESAPPTLPRTEGPEEGCQD